jgi:hypothetical protein
MVLKSERGQRLPTFVAKSVLWIAQFPILVNRVFTEGHPLIIGENTTGAPTLANARIPTQGHFLLVSTLSEEHRRPTIRLVRLHDTKVLHEWIPDYDEIFMRLDSVGHELPHISHGRFLPSKGPISVILNSDFSIVFNLREGPLVRIDSASNIEWVVGRNFHHSLERDVDGNYWLPVILYDSPSSKRFGIQDDALSKVSPSGEVLYTKSIFDIFVENGLRRHLVGAGLQSAPVHLNDVEPVLTDSDYWKKGDLFMSLRHASSVFLFRPSTNEVLWVGDGPWLNQHDVDIIDSTRISIFGNDNLRDFGRNFGRRPWSLADNSDLYVYNFATALISTPYSSVFAEAGIRTVTEGKAQIQPDGLLFVDETETGRHLLIDSVGIRWQFVELAEGGDVLYPGWTRLLRRDSNGDYVE